MMATAVPLPQEQPEDQVFGPTEVIPGRGFCDPAETRRDALVMADMLALERAVARRWHRDVEGPGIIEEAVEGTRRMLAVPNGAALLRAASVTAVGFFGQLREGVDHAVLFEHERRIAKTFPEHARFGFLSYFDIGPEHGKYGNLILFGTPSVPAEWHANPAHQQAVAIAPAHYEFVRLHKGRIAGPLMGEGKLHIERTQYLDFRDGRTWRAARAYRSREDQPLSG